MNSANGRHVIVVDNGLFQPCLGGPQANVDSHADRGRESYRVRSAHHARGDRKADGLARPRRCVCASTLDTPYSSDELAAEAAGEGFEGAHGGSGLRCGGDEQDDHVNGGVVEGAGPIHGLFAAADHD
jgi:hypothetical protein